jgi:hypothetical protein
MSLLGKECYLPLSKKSDLREARSDRPSEAFFLSRLFMFTIEITEFYTYQELKVQVTYF